VRIVAPAGPFDRPSFEAGLAVLSRRYVCSFADPGLFAQERYLAGPDARRLVELTEALRTPPPTAVFAARGGYGSMRLLPQLDLTSPSPHFVIGFSDLTAIHGALQAVGRVSIHGPVLTQLGRAPSVAVEWLYSLLETGLPPAALEGAECLVPGTVEGPLLGGNFSVFTRLLGTPYLPTLDGAILLLEDIRERPYQIDRMWTHLALAGVFRRIAGIALGQFTNCDEPNDPTLRADATLRALAKEQGVPCAMGFPIGHEDDNRAVALGTRVCLEATTGRLVFLESAVQEGAA
jgi:muramoyltetrapeptide carboxypeptidase